MLCLPCLTKKTTSTFLKTSRLTTTSMTICVSKQNFTTITMSLHQNQCIISPSLSVHRNYITQARVLLCSIYQRPSNGHYVVLSLPKPISITTSYDLAKAELGSLRDTITARKSTEDYSLIISRWTSDDNSVDIDITPSIGELRIQVQLRVEEADVAGETRRSGKKKADVAIEIREMAALVGRQIGVSEGSYWRGPMDEYQGLQYGRSGMQNPQPDERDPSVRHYVFASTRSRIHGGREEEVPSLFALGVGDANTTILPQRFAGGLIDERT
jgi:hypothetical protein